MPNNFWRGDAVAVAQVNTITPATVSVGNIFNLVINGKTVSYTALAATVADVTAGLVAAITDAQSTVQEFNDVTPADNTTNLTLTAQSPGVPFTQTSSATQGSGSPGMSLSTSTTTTSSGPEDWGVAANWTLGAVPVNGDTVYLTKSGVSIRYSLDQSGVTLAALIHEATFTGDLGLPDYNATGDYYEYRPKKLSISATTAVIGRGDGPGSNLMRIGFGSNAVNLTVYRTGSSQEQGVPPLLIDGAHASNVAQVFSGNVGFGTEAGAGANFPVLRLGYEDSSSTDVSVVCGTAMTLTDVYQNGGTLEINTDYTLLDMRDGSTTVQGSAAGATTALYGGTLVWNSSGSLGDVKGMGSKSTLDFSRDARGRSLTGTAEMGDGATLLDPFATLSLPTPPLGIVVTDLKKVTLDLGRHLVVLTSPGP